MNRYFEKLYIQNKDLVYRTAYSILKNESDAEDVSAEVFCKLYSYLKANRNIRNISGWLRITARTTSIDLLRRKCSSGYLIQSDLYEKDFSDTVFDRAFANQILDVLYRKNPKWFAYITMHYLLEMSYSEIAEATGRTEASVKNAVARTKKYIAEYRKRFIMKEDD